MEPDVLKECYSRYQREVYLYLLSLCKDPHLAEDLLQETFLKALLSLSDSHTNVRAWLHMVARNLFFDYARRTKYTAPQELTETVDNDSDPLEEILKDERNRILYQALSQLEERKREVLELHYFSGLSQREIAAVLHLKSGYVRVLALRAKQDIRTWMEGNGYDIS